MRLESGVSAKCEVICDEPATLKLRMLAACCLSGVLPARTSSTRAFHAALHAVSVVPCAAAVYSAVRCSVSLLCWPHSVDGSTDQHPRHAARLSAESLAATARSQNK